MIWQVFKGLVNLMGLAAPLFKCVISAMCNHGAGPGAKFVSSGCCCEKRSMRHGVLIWQDMAGKLEKFKVWPDVQYWWPGCAGSPGSLLGSPVMSFFFFGSGSLLLFSFSWVGGGESCYIVLMLWQCVVLR